MTKRYLHVMTPSYGCRFRVRGLGLLPPVLRAAGASRRTAPLRRSGLLLCTPRVAFGRAGKIGGVEMPRDT